MSPHKSLWSTFALSIAFLHLPLLAEPLCTPPAWYAEGARINDHEASSHAKGTLLSEAIKNAQSELWHALYTGGNKNERLEVDDILGPGIAVYSEQAIDNAIHVIFRTALAHVPRNRKYEHQCNQYFLNVKLDTTQISPSLFDKKIVKELVRFILQNEHHLVKEELRWQNFWRQQGLGVPDRSKAIEECYVRAKGLLKSKIPLQKEVGAILSEMTKETERSYVHALSERHEELFLTARKPLMQKIAKFDAIDIASKGLESLEQTLEKFKKLAYLGEPRAYRILAMLSLKGIGTDKPKESAHKWTLLGFRNGDEAVRHQLANQFIKGLGTEKDFKEAVDLLEPLLDSKNPEVPLKLGQLQLSGGHGLEKNLKKATTLLEQAAQLESGKAAFILGKLYFDGKSVEKDLQVSKKWLEKSKDLGFKPAARLLNKHFLQKSKQKPITPLPKKKKPSKTAPKTQGKQKK